MSFLKKKNLLITGWFLVVAVSCVGAQQSPAAAADPAVSSGEDTAFFARLLPLHRVKTPPGPYDWLAQQKEDGQTFAQYVAEKPVLPDGKKKYIYITLLGDFSPKGKEIIVETAKVIEIFFGLPVKWAEPLPLSVIPAKAQRVHPQTGDKQILSTYVIDEVLVPRIPADAFCFIAFTPSDLWPGEGWNFVFGQASLDDRVGVWSIYRNGNPDGDAAEYQLCLKRTIKTGTHEIGHMFSLKHCIYYECLMNGSNYRKEADSRPMELCPVCLRKLAWALHFDVSKRYQRLAEIYQQLGFPEEASFCRESLRILRDK